MNIKPLSNHIFIEASKEEQTSKGGIFIPESSEDKPIIGKIIAIGPGKLNEEGKLIPMNVKVGDKVSKGQVLGIVEAMKLMNEIESEFDGTVKEILVENEQMVEFGQPMFVIE